MKSEPTTTSAQGFHATEAVFAALVIVALTVPLQLRFARGRGPLLLIVQAAMILVLSLTLIVLTLRSDLHGPRRWFLLMCGFAAVAFPAAVLLHNAVFAAGIALFGEDFWPGLGMPDGEPVFFVLAVVVSPLAFLVAVLGTCATYLLPFIKR